jgi:signal peptidase I
MDLMTESVTLRKSTPLRRILAIVLSILGAGLGHVVMGYPQKGLKWFGIVLLLWAGFVGSIVADSPRFVWTIFVLFVCVRIAAILETVRITVAAVAAQTMSIVLIVIGMSAVSYISGVAGTQLARAYRMPTTSMYPSLEVGDLFVSSRVLSKLQRGQVIVFNYPRDQTKSYVQRIVGLPGDSIAMRRGTLILNGRPIDKRPVSDPCGTLEIQCTIAEETIDGNTYKVMMNSQLFDPKSREFGPVIVPDGKLFVLGDNRDNSADSRYWGYRSNWSWQNRSLSTGHPVTRVFVGIGLTRSCTRHTRV